MQNAKQRATSWTSSTEQARRRLPARVCFRPIADTSAGCDIVAVSSLARKVAIAVASLYCAAVLFLEWWLGELSYAWAHPDGRSVYNFAILIHTIALAAIACGPNRTISKIALTLLLLFVTLCGVRFVYFLLTPMGHGLLLGLLVIALWELAAVLLLLPWLAFLRIKKRKRST